MKIKKKRLKRIAKNMADYAAVANLTKIIEPENRISYHMMEGMKRALELAGIKVKYKYDSEDNITSINMPEYGIKQPVDFETK